MHKLLKMNALALATLMAAQTAGAAGLGRLSVTSALGQPLRAEIELLAVQPEELGTLGVKIANQEAFRQARLERSEAVGSLQLYVEQRPGGKPVLRITSPQAINDPFLDLLIELNWSSGRILREYTVLLDPPSDSRGEAAPPAQPAATVASEPSVPATVASKAKSSAPSKAKSRKSGEKAAEEAAEKTAEAATPAGDKTTYGPVKSGENLRIIAEKVKHADVSIEMMIAGLYQANKQSFVRDNMNLLRKGTTLTVPDKDAVLKELTPKQAHELIVEHSRSWVAYRGQVADMAAAKAPTPAESAPAKDAAKGKVTPAPEKTKPTPAPAAGADVLKLSKGQPAVDAKAQQKQQALQEEVAAKARALNEANERVAHLEKTVQDMQKLIKLKDQQAKETKVAPPPPSAKAKEAAVPAPKPAPAAEPPVKVAPPPPPSEEPGFLSSLIANPLYIGGAIAALLLAILGWMTFSRRRHRDLAQLEQSVINSGDDFKTAIFRTTAGTSTHAPMTQTQKQTSVMTDFSRLGLGAIDTHEVDPIAEAEVYMAYGRDAQAEEILKEALSKDPSRHEIALKLLEIYATRHDTVAFETQASEIYAALSGQPTPLWGKVAELGRSIDPENPLYQYRGAEEFPVAPEPEVYRPGADVLKDTSVMHDEYHEMEDIGRQAPPEQSMANLFTDDEKLEPMADADGALDFQLDTDIQAQPFDDEKPIELGKVSSFADAKPASDFDIDFPDIDIDGFTSRNQPDAGVEEAVEDLEEKIDAGAASLPDMDFSNIDLELKEPVGEIHPAEIASVDMPDAETEITPEQHDDPELWEEVNTKIDLAKAYLEMGDKEGAREILDEVMREGDRQQKEQANELIASLS